MKIKNQTIIKKGLLLLKSFSYFSNKRITICEQAYLTLTSRFVAKVSGAS